MNGQAWQPGFHNSQPHVATFHFLAAESAKDARGIGREGVCNDKCSLAEAGRGWCTHPHIRQCLPWQNQPEPPSSHHGRIKSTWSEVESDKGSTFPCLSIFFKCLCCCLCHCLCLCPCRCLCLWLCQWQPKHFPVLCFVGTHTVGQCMFSPRASINLFHCSHMAGSNKSLVKTVQPHLNCINNC